MNPSTPWYAPKEFHIRLSYDEIGAVRLRHMVEAVITGDVKLLCVPSAPLRSGPSRFFEMPETPVL